MKDNKDIRGHQVEYTPHRCAHGEYIPGEYKEEARTFLKECLGEEMYSSIMNSDESRRLPHVAARIFLNDEQWAKYVWIERCGSLEGFSE